MSIRVEHAEGTAALEEFARLHDRVYAARSAHWPASVAFDVAMLAGVTPYTEDRILRPLVARQDGEVVARVLAVVDRRYQRRWHEPLGHFAMFEALPDTEEATVRLVDAAAAWLADADVQAMRAGFLPGFDDPFMLDDYDSLPLAFSRQNPAYYHSLLTGAGFEAERRFVDYHVAVQPELLRRWESACDAVRRDGFAIVPLRDVPEARRVRDVTRTWNDAFASHWGMTPFTEREFALMMNLAAMRAEPSALDCSVLAYAGDEPVGVLWVVPSDTTGAVLAPGRALADHERLNFLGIGVLPPGRGRGVSVGMAAHAYLRLAGAGFPMVGYGLVLDDNWSSRRTAEKLGATVASHWQVYRRPLSA